MPTGAITSYIDVAQLTLYAFFLFFGCLIFYLRREDKREGYPCESDRSERSPRVAITGFPAPPSPKTFLLTHGGTYQAPGGNPDDREIKAKPVALWPGAPLQPTGDPMVDAVGPASYALRSDEPDLTVDGDPRITPMRVSQGVTIARGDPDPRGMEVVGADRVVAGAVKDVWVDHTEPNARYYEVELAEGGKSVLLPVAMSRVNAWRRQVKVRSIKAHQFANVPALRNPHQVSKREEDMITAYYAGGTLYADPSRLWPAL